MIYLVDINLPKEFSFFKNGNFVFVKDISNSLPDGEIWNLALGKITPFLSATKIFTTVHCNPPIAPKLYCSGWGISKTIS